MRKHKYKKRLKQEEGKDYSVLFKVLGITIPLIILGLVLYINFLPFGYSKDIILDVGTPNDDEGELKIILSDSVGPRQSLEGTFFRAIDGTAEIKYTPKVVLRNATITAKIEGDGVYFTKLPNIDELDWDYEWDINNFLDYFVVEAPHTIYPQLKQGTTIQPNNIKINTNTNTNENTNINTTQDENKTINEDHADYAYSIIINYNASREHSFLEGLIKQDLANLIIQTNNEELIKIRLPDYYLEQENEIVIGITPNKVYLYINEELLQEKENEEISQRILKHIAEMETDEEASEEEVTIKRLTTERIEETIEEREGCLYFDGKTRLVLPNSTDRFEDGPFVVYVEYEPHKKEDRQQIIGHFNWELEQRSNNIHYRIGRTTETDSFYGIVAAFSDDYFNNKNSVVLIYNPSEKGYVEMYLNNNFIERREIGNNTLQKDYSRDLSLGHSEHGSGELPLLEGKICSVKFGYFELDDEEVKEKTFHNVNDDFKFSVIGEGTLEKIKLSVER